MCVISAFQIFLNVVNRLGCWTYTLPCKEFTVPADGVKQETLNLESAQTTMPALAAFGYLTVLRSVRTAC